MSITWCRGLRYQSGTVRPTGGRRYKVPQPGRWNVESQYEKNGRGYCERKDDQPYTLPYEDYKPITSAVKRSVPRTLRNKYLEEEEDIDTPSTLDQEQPPAMTPFGEIHRLLHQKNVVEAEKRFLDIVNSGEKIEVSFYVTWFSSLHKLVTSPVEYEAKIMESKVFDTTISIDVLNTVVQGFIKLKDYARAKKYLDMIPLRGLQPNAFTYLNYTHMAIHQGNLKQAQEHVEFVLDTMDAPSTLSTLCCNLLLEAYIKANDNTSKTKLLQIMETKGVSASAYTAHLLLNTSTKEVKIQALSKFLKGEVDLDLANITTAFQALCQQGDVNVITMVFDSLRELCAPDEVLFCTVITALGKLNDTTAMIRYFNMMSEHQLKPNVVIFTNIIGTFARLGDTQTMLHYFNTMQQLGIQPNTVTFGVVISAFKQKGDRYNTNKYKQMAMQSSINNHKGIR